jgi:hypothetical protein
MSLDRAAAPGGIPPGGSPACWKAEYAGRGSAEVWICAYKASTSAFDAVQRGATRAGRSAGGQVSAGALSGAGEVERCSEGQPHGAGAGDSESCSDAIRFVAASSCVGAPEGDVRGAVLNFGMGRSEVPGRVPDKPAASRCQYGGLGVRKICDVSNPQVLPEGFQAIPFRAESAQGRVIIIDEHMFLRAVLFRSVALFVLVTSAFDYCAFDVWDPAAPMSSTRSEIIRDLVPHHQTSAMIATSESADDQCLGCAPGISPCPPVLHRVTPNSFVFQATEAAVPSRDPSLIERPPRA